MNKGRLFLIPTPLGEGDPSEVLPASVLSRVCSLKVFVVEELRTARRFLSKAGLKGHMDELEFHVLNEHTPESELALLGRLFDDGQDAGLMSEAGLPAVADPGAALVALCHREGVEVVPLTGPSSLMLALMGSGLDGQSFAFRGYLPAKTEDRKKAIRAAEKLSASLHQTQIFIETPYRNDTLMADLLRELSPSVRLCIAADLTLKGSLLKTRTVSQWRKDGITIGKRPCVFLFLA
ncbi:MAG: SAM-dependent methyltransferase [Candidatus Cryptobacteroides sp.]|nr:SAM-dependent methyltransferase [Candidatus Cryptobacteroides sp.]